jgi:hypothetical protein
MESEGSSPCSQQPATRLCTLLQDFTYFIQNHHPNMPGSSKCSLSSRRKDICDLWFRKKRVIFSLSQHTPGMIEENCEKFCNKAGLQAENLSGDLANTKQECLPLSHDFRRNWCNVFTRSVTDVHELNALWWGYVLSLSTLPPTSFITETTQRIWVTASQCRTRSEFSLP